MLLGNALDVCAGPVLVLVQREEAAAFLNGEAQRSGAAEEIQLVQVALTEVPVAVGFALRPDQADILVVADRLAGRPERAATSPMFMIVSSFGRGECRGAARRLCFLIHGGAQAPQSQCIAQHED